MLKTLAQKLPAALLTLTVVILASNAVATTEYSVRELGQLKAGETSVAYGVNDAGVAVGTAIGANGSFSAVRFNLDGSVTELAQLSPGYQSAALDINNAGIMVGYALTGYSVQGLEIPAAVIFNEDGTLTELGELIPLKPSVAHAINNQGTIVGSASDNNGISRAVIFEGGGVVTPLGYLGSLPGNSVASAINDDGLIVGTSSTSDKSDMFRATIFHQDGTATNLYAPNQTSYAYGVSSAGEIVGAVKTPSSDPSPNVDFGSLFDGSGGVSSLGQLEPGLASIALGANSAGVIVGFGDTPLQRTAVVFDRDTGTVVPLADRIEATHSGNWILETAYAVSESGQIVGGGKLNPGTLTGYILTPVPEPNAILLGLAALTVIPALARRRTRA
jgi:uncharacterized membrane protein